MKLEKPILGVHLGFTIDSLFISPQYITDEETFDKLKQEVAQMSKRIENVLNEQLTTTEFDSFVVDPVIIDYIDEEHIQDYVY